MNKSLPTLKSMKVDAYDFFVDWLPIATKKKTRTNLKLLLLNAFLISLNAMRPTNLNELIYAITATYGIFWILCIAEFCINLLSVMFEELKQGFRFATIAAIIYFSIVLVSVTYPIMSFNK